MAWSNLDKYFIVAGTHEEFRTWLQLNRRRFPYNNINDFIYVDRPMVFLGHAYPHGFFVGTFKQRPDLFEIIQTIITNSPDLSAQAIKEFIDRILPSANRKNEP